jgi:hypothetical protein
MFDCSFARSPPLPAELLAEPMLRVNREMGLVVTGYTHEWQKWLG